MTIDMAIAECSCGRRKYAFTEVDAAAALEGHICLNAMSDEELHQVIEKARGINAVPTGIILE
jgi:hypothetical protein